MRIRGVWAVVMATSLAGTLALLIWGVVADDSTIQIVGFALTGFGVALTIVSWWWGAHVRRVDQVEAAEAGYDAVVERIPTTVAPLDPDGSKPSDLLDPRQQVMPFRGRWVEIEELRAWCLDPSASSVFFVEGPALSGKTRLWIQLAKEGLGDEWRLSLLRQGHGREAFAALNKITGRHLVVVDASMNDPNLSTFLTDLASAVEPARWRLLLVCRSRSIFSHQLSAEARSYIATAESFLDGALGVFGDVRDHMEWREEFSNVFGTILRRHGWTRPEEARLGRPELIGVLGARALAQGLNAGSTDKELFVSLADAELAHWPLHPVLGDPPHSVGTSLARCYFALLWMIGAKTQDELRLIADQLKGEEVISSREMASYMTRLYPSESGQFQPPNDTISAAMAVPELLLDPNRTAAQVLRTPAGVPGLIVGRLLSVAHDYPEVEVLADRILEATTTAITPQVLAALIEHTPLDTIHDVTLSSLVASHPPEDATSLEDLADELQDNHMAGAAVEAHRLITLRYGELAKIKPDSYLPELAKSLSSYALSLRDVGEYRRALTQAEEALDIHRGLVKAAPEDCLPDLAKSLGTYATSLGDVGELEQALATAREAVDIFRRLAKANAEDGHADLAGSLTNCAVWLGELGEREESLALAKEAVDILRRLAHTRPEGNLSLFASSLSNYSNKLGDLGEREEALAVAKESLDIRRELAKAEPEAFLPDLAIQLNNYAVGLSDAGEFENSLALAKEAVDTYRRLAQAYPKAYLPNLAGSLTNYATSLGDLGEYWRAVKPAEEAVEISRGLVTADPEVFLPHLARTLTVYATSLGHVGEREEALAPSKESVDLYRRLAGAHPKPNLPRLAGSLSNYAAVLGDVGEHEEALTTSGEAVDILRGVAEDDPGANVHQLVGSLINFASALAAMDKHQDAINAAQEGLDQLSQHELMFLERDRIESALRETIQRAREFLQHGGQRANY